MKRYSTLLLLFFVLVGCKDDQEPDIVQEDGVNGWIYTVMKKNYLWQEEIPEYEKTERTLSATKYFNSLISENEKKGSGTTTSWYSYIEAVTKTQTRVLNNNGYSYGMQFVLTRIDESINYYARVLYVVPGSPADAAGIKRGMWIMKMDNKSINATNYTSLFGGSQKELIVYVGRYEDNMLNQGYSLTLPAAVEMNESPIHLYNVMTVGDKNIGYLSYNAFQTGPSGFQDKTWENDLVGAFNYFKSAGVDELIVDLRYNGGGYLTTSQLLASMIAPGHAANQAYCRITYNSVRSPQYRDYNFLSSYAGMLNLSRVYFLMGRNTASASEAVFNGLSASGIMETIHVGWKTEGKNLGSEEYTDSRYDYILHPIVAKIVNKDGNGDYWNGFVPSQASLTYDELTNRSPLGELGTPEDHVINLALQDMLPGVFAPQRLSPASLSGTDIPAKDIVCTSLEERTVQGIRLTE